MSATRRTRVTEVPGLLGYDEGSGDVLVPRRFKVGDRVEWTSQSNGTSKKKSGEVVAVVRARGTALFFLPVGTSLSVAKKFGNPRRHESYLVRVGMVIYWPLVKHLRPAL